MTDDMKAEKPGGLGLMRAPFAENQISKLPKESRAQIDARKADRNTSINCTVCGGWHHKNAVHLDYVGHAALTDRLLDVDVEWSWEPVAFNAEGLPAFDKNGGLWIRLTICGITRLGYGDADGKQGGNAVKEAIGDALRNAAMRFGAALDLWHKGDLHAEEPSEERQQGTGQRGGGNGSQQADRTPEQDAERYCSNFIAWMQKCEDIKLLDDRIAQEQIGIKRLKDDYPKLFAQFDHAKGLAYARLDDVPF